MRGLFRSKAWGRLGCLAVLGAVLGVMAGCATGYAFVQPTAAGSGAYYASDGPYPGQGYYDYYGTGPYYPGTSGYGYYNGAYPYSDQSGWYDGEYGYWPFFTFNVGTSNVWDFPGYWGPWYTGAFPVWGCRRRDCGDRDRHHWRDHDYRRDRDHGRDRHTAVVTSPDPWLKREPAPVPSRLARASALPVRGVPARSAERFASRPPLPSTAFAPHGVARAPVEPSGGERFMGIPARRIAMPQAPAEPEFPNRPAMPTPVRQGFQPAPEPAFRAAPASPRIAPVSRPSPQRADAPPIRIH